MKIVKFEKNNCRDCVVVGNFLNNQDINYDIVNIESPDADLDFISKYVDFAIPVTVLLNDAEDLLLKSVKFNENELLEIVEKFKGE